MTGIQVEKENLGVENWNLEIKESKEKQERRVPKDKKG